MDNAYKYTPTGKIGVTGGELAEIYIHEQQILSLINNRQAEKLPNQSKE